MPSTLRRLGAHGVLGLGILGILGVLGALGVLGGARNTQDGQYKWNTGYWKCSMYPEYSIARILRILKATI